MSREHKEAVRMFIAAWLADSSLAPTGRARPRRVAEPSHRDRTLAHLAHVTDPRIDRSTPLSKTPFFGWDHG